MNFKALLDEFFKFLREFKIISLALAFIMGSAAITLINSLVKDIVMPIFAPIFSSLYWETAILSIGPIHIRYGAFFGELLNFVILMAVIFVVIKFVLKQEKLSK